MAESLSVREATPDDEADIAEVDRLATASLREVYRPTGVALERRSEVAASLRRWVATLDGRVMGVVQHYVADGTLHLLGLGVHPTARRRGVARALIEHLSGLARRNGCHTLVLRTIRQTGNVAVFERLGFSVKAEGVTELFTSDRFAALSEVVMTRPVAESLPMFSSNKPVIGMVHVGALPGTPGGGATLGELEQRTVKECAIYREHGVHGIIVENMHDVPYLSGTVGPEITAAMTVLALAARRSSGLPCGIQILAGANHEAMAVAHAAGLDFVRVEGFAFAHVADEGIIQSSAGSLLRFRRYIGADRVQVWADVKKKHAAHALTADVSIGETAAAVEFMRADAVIVTGSATGAQPTDDDIAQVRERCTLPLYLGSGITADNLPQYFTRADGFIVGSAFKKDGRWDEAIDERRVEAFMAAHARSDADGNVLSR